MSGAVPGQFHPDSELFSQNAVPSARVDIDAARIRAELILNRTPGHQLMLRDIAEAIRQSSLRKLDSEYIKSEVMRFLNGTERCAKIILKQGQAPGKGPDRTLDFLIDFYVPDTAAEIRKRMEQRSNRDIPSLMEFPLCSSTKMSPVSKGQKLARLSAPQTGEPGTNIDGQELPGLPGNDPDIRLYEGLKWDGDAVVADADGILDADGDSSVRLRIRPHRDAQISVTISEDQMKALVSVQLPAGTGASVRPRDVQKAAENAGVIKGLSVQAAESIAARSAAGEIILNEVIAEGRFQMQDGSALSQELPGNPAVRPVPVKTGDITGVLHSQTEGGWNVLGQTLTEQPLTIGKNLLRGPEVDGRTVLKAEKGGHLLIEDGILRIRHVLKISEDITAASGPVRYPGRIKIDASVLNKAVVDGGEGVEITEVVQAALVNSDRGITIGKGIKGEGTAVVRSRGSLKTGYAENANIFSTENILAQKSLMNCRIKCNGRVLLSGEDGRLTGGVLKAKNGLHCRGAGNKRGLETVISFGQDYLIENQIEQIQKDITRLHSHIAQIDQLMETYKNQNAGAKLMSIRQKKVDALKVIKKKNVRLFLLHERFEQHFDSEVRISGTVWPGTVFESHGRLLKIDRPLSGLLLTFNRNTGKIEAGRL